MKRDMPWWTGAAALGWFVALVTQTFLNKLSDVDVSEPTPATSYLRAIAANRAAFTGEAAIGAVTCVLALVTLVGIVLALKDGPLLEGAAVGGVLFFAGALILLVSFAMYGNLVGTAMEYVQGSYASTSVLVQQGDMQGDQFLIIYFLGQVTLALGIGALSLMLVKAGVMGTVFAVIAVLLVPLSLLMYHLASAFMLARLAWLGLLAAHSFSGPERMPAMAEVEI
jgi:uncharacterized membrane protein